MTKKRLVETRKRHWMRVWPMIILLHCSSCSLIKSQNSFFPIFLFAFSLGHHDSENVNDAIYTIDSW